MIRRNEPYRRSIHVAPEPNEGLGCKVLVLERVAISFDFSL
jgi:hypothetical protein